MHWESVQGESNPLKLCSHEYEHEHVGYHFASFLIEIRFRLLNFESTVRIIYRKSGKNEGWPTKLTFKNSRSFEIFHLSTTQVFILYKIHPTSLQISSSRNFFV